MDSFRDGYNAGYDSGSHASPWIVLGIMLIIGLTLWLERRAIRAHPWQHGIGIPLFIVFVLSFIR